MAVRQYIGVRYVPKFMGTYDATQAYEALSVVDNGLGTSYISKVPTPAGTPLTNTTYWAIYGASSGAIINLQNQIDDMNDGSVPGSLQNQIDNLNDVTSRNIIVIGNSFVNEGVANALIADFDNSYKYTGSGIGFCTYSGHTTTFEDKLDEAILNSAFDNDTITDILFVSAMGDTIAYDESSATYTANVLATLASIKTKIETNFPNCKRIMVTLAETRSVAKNSYTSKYSTMFTIHRLFTKSLHQFNMQYLGWSGFNVLLEGSQYTLPDEYHPSALGATFIGSFIKDSYYGHAEYITKYTVAHINFKYTATAKLTVVAKFTPEMVQINNMIVRDTAGAAVTIGSGTTIAEFSELAKPFPPCSDYPTFCSTPLTKQADGTQLDYFIIEVGAADNDGIATLRLVNGPSAATIGASECLLPNISNVTYYF